MPDIQMDQVQSGGLEPKTGINPIKKNSHIIESSFNVKDFLKEYKYEILSGLLILGSVIFSTRDKINYLFHSYNPIKRGMNPKIPRVIYQCYKDKNVPPIVKERWLKLNPDFEYHLYDNEDCYQFLLDYYEFGV